MSEIQKQNSVPFRMDLVVKNVLSEENLEGFEKAYLMAKGMDEIKTMLTNEYMKPIMNLQGKKLGFKTDKTYSLEVVKDCLIEAVFMGLQPYGNEFNIISGNCYPTKEGMGALLKKLKGLKYEITPKLPRISDKSAAVVMSIKWSYKGSEGEKELDIPIKVNNFMGTDAIIGKATRKARAWLYGTVTGYEIVDGDVDDADFKIITKPKSIHKQKLTTEEIELHLSSASNKDEVDDLWKKLDESQQTKYLSKFDEKSKTL